MYPDPFKPQASRGPAFRLIKPEYQNLWGFGVHNRGDDPTQDEFEGVFGENAYYHVWEPIGGWHRVPNPAYWWVYEPIYYDTMGNTGTCVGISSTSLMTYQGAYNMMYYDSASLYPIAVTDWGMPAVYDTSSTPHKPQNLWAVIRVNHGVQKSDEFICAELDESSDFNYQGDPVARYHELENHPLEYVLVIRYEGKGHALVPYLVKDGKIYVYDCNHPGELCAINIDFATNTYTYNLAGDNSGTESWSGNKLTLIPISVWYGSRHMPGIGTGVNWLFAAVRGIGTIETSTGSVGIDAADKFTENNPEGWVVVPDNSNGTARSFGLAMRPDAAPPTVKVAAGNTDFDFFVSESGRIMQAGISDADGCDAGMLKLGYEGDLLSNLRFSTSGSASNVTIKAGIADDNKALVFGWSGVDMINGELGCGLVGANGAQYRNTSASMSTYILTVNIVDVTSGTYGTYLYGPFEIPSGAIHKVTLKNWPNCATLVSEIDLNGDGIADMVNEEVAGGLLETPLDEQTDNDNNGVPDQFNTQQTQAVVAHTVTSARAFGDVLVWAIPVFVVAAVGVVILPVLVKKEKIMHKKQ